jgi:asparagine synthase (glutamine-hydrolysing)
MCGILGYISNKNIDRKFLNDILESQFRRGPDYSHVEYLRLGELFCGIGHNRLNIIDNTINSNQPFWDLKRNEVVIYNGEIYNYLELKLELENLGYKFSTSGDTEVLLYSLKEWGEQSLKKINGMFAFFYLNLNERKVLLARDRFGKKPLYYYHRGEEFVFASTTAIIAKEFNLEPDYNYLKDGLELLHYENGSDRTQYIGLKNLQGGNYLRIDLARNTIEVSKHIFYELKTYQQEEFSFDLGFGSAVSKFKNLFVDSVKIRLQSDVPLGLSLSGGLDSTAIAVIAKENYSNLCAFNLGSPNDYNTEGPLVRLIEKRLGLNVCYINNLNKYELIDSFEKCLESQDSPLLSLSYLAENLVYKAANDFGIRVMLGGQGADEAFMGYNKYHFIAAKSYLLKLRIDQVCLSAISIAKSFSQNRNIQMAMFQSMMRYIGIKRLGLIEFPNDDYELNEMTKESNRMRVNQIFDIRKLSIPTQLKSEDSNSMCYGVETRAPFLDYRLVEFGISLPDTFKIHNGYGKWIIRNAMKGQLPEEILFNRVKRGYDVAENWISNGLGDHIRYRLKSQSDFLSKFLRKNQSLDIFTDEYLIRNKSAFQEATTLIWLTKFA